MLRIRSLPIKPEPRPRGVLTIRIAPSHHQSLGYIARINVGGHDADHAAASARARALKAGSPVVVYANGLQLDRHTGHLVCIDAEILLDTPPCQNQPQEQLLSKT